MVYVDNKRTAEEINFLKSEHVVSFTAQATSNTAGVTGGVLPAGTIYPANDGTALGVVYNAVDVTKGPQPISVITEGHILAERLPVEPTAEAIAVLNQINFYDADGAIYAPEVSGE